MQGARTVIRRRRLMATHPIESTRIDRDVVVVRQIKVSRRIQCHTSTDNADLRRIGHEDVERIDCTFTVEPRAAIIHNVNILAGHGRHALPEVEHEIRANLQIVYSV